MLRRQISGYLYFDYSSFVVIEVVWCDATNLHKFVMSWRGTPGGSHTNCHSAPVESYEGTTGWNIRWDSTRFPTNVDPLKDYGNGTLQQAVHDLYFLWRRRFNADDCIEDGADVPNLRIQFIIGRRICTLRQLSCSCERRSCRGLSICQIRIVTDETDAFNCTWWWNQVLRYTYKATRWANAERNRALRRHLQSFHGLWRSAVCIRVLIYVW